MLIFSYKCLFLDSTTVALHDSQLWFIYVLLGFGTAPLFIKKKKKNPVLALKCKKQTNKQKKVFESLVVVCCCLHL